MRITVPAAAAALLLAACATLPPLRPADPSQAVPNEKSSATAFADGVRIVVRPGAWDGGEDLEQYLTPVEVAIHNGSNRRLQVRPSEFSLLAPGGFRYDALSTEDVRRILGPLRGGIYGGYGYAFVPWGVPFTPWGGPYGGWWGWEGFGPAPWWGPVVYYGAPGYRIPSSALAQGTLEPGGNATVLVFFPVPAEKLNALELDASLADAAGQRVAELRVPFVREGRHAQAIALPPTATPPAGAAPAQPPPSWQTTPPPRPQQQPPPPPEQQPSPPQQPPVDQPVGPAVPPPESSR